MHGRPTYVSWVELRDQFEIDIHPIRPPILSTVIKLTMELPVHSLPAVFLDCEHLITDFLPQLLHNWIIEVPVDQEQLQYIVVSLAQRLF